MRPRGPRGGDGCIVTEERPRRIAAGRARGSNMATDPKSTIPDEPEELSIWREIARHRDVLVRAIADEERNVRFARRVAEKLGTPSDLAAELEAEARADAQAAREQLNWLDREIRERRETSPPPRKLLEQLRVHVLLLAVDAVGAFIRAGSGPREGYAQGLIDSIARMYGGSAGPIHEMLAEARAQRSESDDSGTSVARYVVAKAAGLPPNSRLLRRNKMLH